MTLSKQLKLSDTFEIKQSINMVCTYLLASPISAPGPAPPCE